MAIDLNKSSGRTTRLVLGALIIIGLGWAMVYSGRVAISRILVKYGTTVVDTEAVATSIGMTPDDAEAHYARGALLNHLRQPDAALKELELAVSLRPRDYDFWLELGLTRDELGDQVGALACFNQAIRLAPYYAQPRWQRGNLLFRMARYDEAFSDLRQATISNPEFLPNFIDLAWGASQKDAQKTEQLVQPQSNQAHYALAVFFARHGKPDEAVSYFRSAGAVSNEARRDLVRALLSAGANKQAFAVWSNSAAGTPAGAPSIYDGGFEGTLNLDESGFGWRLAAPQPGVSFSLDGSQPQSGSRSLRIDFSGHAGPEMELVSQMILVQPGEHYKLSFSARTHNIVTGGPLVLVVKEANGKQSLGRSSRFPADSTGWQAYSLEFGAGAATQAVVLSLQREPCSTAPCPVFGSLNLDSFSLERVSASGLK